MTFIAYGTFGRGLLTGAYRAFGDLAEKDRRRDHPRYKDGNLERNVELVGTLEAIAKAKNATPAQVALAWVMAQGDDILPIPGAKTRAHLEENVGAVNVSLSKSDLERLDQAFPYGVAAGPRYGERQLARVNR